MRILSTLLLVAAATSIPAAYAKADSEVVQPAINDQVIDTADGVLQIVKIRLKSFGPGFCQVTVGFAGSSYSLAAPPLTWSPWFDVGPAVSGGAYKLEFAPGCDTGALGEVKFWSD